MGCVLVKKQVFATSFSQCVFSREFSSFSYLQILKHYLTSKKNESCNTFSNHYAVQKL